MIDVAAAAVDLADDDIEPADLLPELEGDEFLNPDRPYVFANMRFGFKREDTALLERAHLAATQRFQELFTEAIGLLDDLYIRMRIPRTGAHGQPLTDDQGRVVWLLDERTTRPVERLDQLTGQDIDETILGLERIILDVTPEINRLRLEALAAQEISRDSFDDAWPLSGTEADRTARARRNNTTRQDRWFSFFTYYLFSTAHSFFQELRSFVRRLDSIRYRQQQSQ